MGGARSRRSHIGVCLGEGRESSFPLILPRYSHTASLPLRSREGIFQSQDRRPIWAVGFVRRAAETSFRSSASLLHCAAARLPTRCGRQWTPGIPSRADRKRFHFGNAERPGRRWFPLEFLAERRAKLAMQSRQVLPRLRPPSDQTRFAL